MKKMPQPVSSSSQKLEFTIFVAEKPKPLYAVKKRVRGLTVLVLAVPPLWRN